MASLHLPEASLTRADLQYCGSAMVPQNTIPQDLDFGKDAFLFSMNIPSIILL
jgi:hypothetical protein